MKNIQGKRPQTALSRFLLGAGIGIAISVPLFITVDDWLIRGLLMSAFAGISGLGQVFAGGESERAKRLTRWLLGIGAVTFAAGIVTFLLMN